MSNPVQSDTGLTARDALEQRLDDYLEGALDAAETRAVERLLADPEVSALLAEALAFRELLGNFPNDAVPVGLEARVFDALGVEDARRVSSRDVRAGDESATGPAQLAFDGAQRAIRENRRSYGGRQAFAGLKYALRPWALLATRGKDDEDAEPRKPSLLRRALRMGRHL